MGKLQISPYVGQGDIVIRRGNKILRKRSAKGQKPYGIWENGHDRITISVDDERIITHQPRGIVRYGVISVKGGDVAANPSSVCSF